MSQLSPAEAACGPLPRSRVGRLATVLIALPMLLAAAAGRAETWTSPEKKISVEVPDASRYVAVGKAPPFSALWIAKDDSLRLGVVTTDWPYAEEISLEGLEKGTVREMLGKIVASSTEVKDGYKVYKLTALGEGAAGTEQAGKKLYLTQGIFVVGNKLFKLMAAGTDRDSNTDSDATRFFSSLKILEPRAAPAEPARPNEDTLDKIARKFGPLAILVVIVCLVLVFVLRKNK